MSSVKRASILAVAAIVAIAAVLPGCANLCCKTSMARHFMAAMRCCANMPTVKTAPTAAMHEDATLTGTTTVHPPALAAIVVAASTVRIPFEFTRAVGRQSDSAPPPPAFLRNEQFRI